MVKRVMRQTVALHFTDLVQSQVNLVQYNRIEANRVHMHDSVMQDVALQ